MARTIVQIGKYYSPVPGGIENNTRQAAEIASLDHRSHVICMRKGRGTEVRETIDGVDVVRLASRGAIWRQELTDSPKLIIDRLKPDIVHFHGPSPLMTLYLLTILPSVPQARLLISHHADLNRPFYFRWPYRAAYAALLGKAARVISYTQIYAQMSRELRRHLKKVEIIPHGTELDTSTHEPRSRREPTRLHVGFLGRIERWKGVDLLLDAARVDRRLVVRIAGDGSDRERLEARASVMGVTDQVTFIGDVRGDDKVRFLKGLDVLVLPSTTSAESFGQVLVEAQLSGAAVVASDLPSGVREICDHGAAGLLFRPGDRKALSASLDTLMDDRVREDLAARGRERALANFTRAAVEGRLRALYAAL